MQWNREKIVGLLAVATVIGAGIGFENAVARRDQSDSKPIPAPKMAAEQDFKAPEAYAPVAIPQNIITYDEVGFASVRDSAADAGAKTMVASNAKLPADTFAEVTNLNTGKTALVLVADDGVEAGHLVDLSPAALAAIGADEGSKVPVRVRRVNPPEQEKAALRQGVAGTERLDTPPALLAALRRKLGGGAAASTQVAVRSVAIPAAMPAASAPKATIAEVMSPHKMASKRPGAPFDAPQPAKQMMSAKSVAVASNDRFIVEDGAGRPSRPRSVPVMTKAAVANPTSRGLEPIVETVGSSVQSSTKSVSYFVQVAAFSDHDRARALASKVNADVMGVGNIWRVRKGPYADASSARAALGPIASKGYRDARITR